MKQPWLAGILVFALAPLTASAQEYAIKIGSPGLGDKSQVTSTGNFDMEFKVLDNAGNAVVEKKETKALRFEFRETGLERAGAGDELVRIKRFYDRGERRINGVRETLPYQGKTLLIQKKDGRFTFLIDNDAGGESLEGKEDDELNEELNKGDFRKLMNAAMLPRKAVKLNETWKLEVAPLARDLMKDGKIEVDEAKSKGSGKLVKIYQKNGKQFGVVELTMEFPVTHVINEGNKSPTKEGKITIKLERDGCIDGSLEQSHLKVTFDADVRADFRANCMDLTLVATIRASAAEQRVPVSK
jgi:hypothetical protein